MRTLTAIGFLAFLITVPLVEFWILRRANAEDREYSFPVRPSVQFFFPNKGKPTNFLISKLLIGLFMFSLVYGLWITRNESDATLPVLVGSAMNLLFIWAAANAIFTVRSQQDKQVT